METVTGPGGRELIYTYDSKGNLLTAEIPGGAEWTYPYNTLNRLTKITDPFNAKTNFTSE